MPGEGIDAARLGNVYVVGDEKAWDGKWFSLGKVPTPELNQVLTSAREHVESFDSIKNAPGGWFWRERTPYGPPWNTGQTGAQARFGLTKGTRAFFYPGQLELLTYCAGDSALRKYHFREADNTRVTAENHPDLRIHSGWTDVRFSRDLLGKVGGPSQHPPWGWDLSRGGPDGQHRGMNYTWAAAALTGDYALLEEALDFVEMDSTWLNNPPAAGGVPRSFRTQQDTAKLWWLMPTQEMRDRCMAIIDRSVEGWYRNPGRSLSGPVKPFDTTRDNRILRAVYTENDPVPPSWVGNTVYSWVPWQEALWCHVAIEVMALAQQQGRNQIVNKLTDLLNQATELCLLYGSAIDTHSGQIFPLNGVKVLPDGQVNPGNYYELQREGTSWGDNGLRFPEYNAAGELVRNGTELLIGGHSWFWWWSGVAEWGASELTGMARERAEMIKNQILRPSSIDDWEWIAYPE
jgi:hypothetical protein